MTWTSIIITDLNYCWRNLSKPNILSHSVEWDEAIESKQLAMCICKQHHGKQTNQYYTCCLLGNPNLDKDWPILSTQCQKSENSHSTWQKKSQRFLTSIRSHLSLKLSKNVIRNERNLIRLCEVPIIFIKSSLFRPIYNSNKAGKNYLLFFQNLFMKILRGFFSPFFVSLSDQKFYFYDFFQTFQRKGRFGAENDENSFLFWELKILFFFGN